MTLGHIHRIVVCIVAAASMAASGTPARAGDALSSPEMQARDLAAEVMHGAGGDDLGMWTRSVIERALERAGEAASKTAADTATPLPAERHAALVGGGVAARPNSGEILVFMSLAVPPASWAQWAREAALVGAADHAGPPLVLRGVGDGGLRETVKAVGVRLGGHEAGVAIDPRLFRLFAVRRVPAVVAVPDGVRPCTSRGCADDPAPPHDLVTGNIGLVSALEAIAAEGDAGRGVARRALERLQGEPR